MELPSVKVCSLKDLLWGPRKSEAKEARVTVGASIGEKKEK